MDISKIILIVCQQAKYFKSKMLTCTEREYTINRKRDAIINYCLYFAFHLVFIPGIFLFKLFNSR